MPPQLIRIGTRASQLALWQANWVKSELENRYPGMEVTLTKIKTIGDKILDVPLAQVGGKGLFVKEIEEAMLRGEIDIAVHSMKDVPTEFPEGLGLHCITEREDPRDALVSKGARNISDLPSGAIVGTSSPRRMAYLRHLRPDLKLINLRGNVDTRVGKIVSGELDATILSYAGLKRLGIAPNEICTPIEVSEIIPAIGQGVIAIETLVSKQNICSNLNHQLTFDLMQAERAYLEHMCADCKTPVAAYARMELEQMVVDFMSAAENDFSKMASRTVRGNVKDAYRLGESMATSMKG